MEKIMAKTKNINFICILRYIGLTFLFFTLNKATINMGYMTPFCFGIYYALIFRKEDNLFTSLCYLIAYFGAFFSLTGLYQVINLIGVALGCKWIHKSLHKNAHSLLICLYAILGNIVYIVYNCGQPKDIIITIISLAIGLLYLYCALHMFKITKRSLNIKLNIDEIMCLCIIVMSIGMGLANINIYSFEILKCLGVLIILILSYVVSIKSTLVTASMLGLGASLHYTNPTYMAVFIMFALCAVGFKSSFKIFSCLAIVMAELVTGFYFASYSIFNIYNVISIIVGEILFLFVPMRTITYVSQQINGIGENVTVRTIINKSRDNLVKRMMEVSNVFLEMDSVYKQMVQGSLSETDAKTILKSELIDKCCNNCSKKNKCMRVDGKISTAIFDDMVDIGFEKGKLNLLDVPQYLTTSCDKVNNVLGTFNALLNSYRRYAVMVNNMDASKILIADQLKGVSLLLRELCHELNLNIVYDIARENRIKEELNYKNICCLDVIVYEQDGSTKYVTLMIKQSEIDNSKVEKIISKIIGTKMYVVSNTTSDIKDTYEVVLKTRPNYDIVFGSSACTKTGKVLSGDTHSLIKIDDGKYMVALCDGMGSGEHAHSVSDLTITLIENFYKAGFDNDIILNSVNKLLSLNTDESFSALDICVLDLRKNLIDFIKLGSPYTFIKHKFETECISSSGLPIGVLEEMKPHITKKVFTDFDIIVMVSDGVMEAFGGGEELQTFINNQSTINPQTLADEVLDRAVELVGGKCEDDFTVLAVRIFNVV